jgi:hypothetical protein
MFALVGIAGFGYGAALKRRRPDIYAAIGIGAGNLGTEHRTPVVRADATLPEVRS